MKQNSPEWLEVRRSKIGASDAPIIMEESPYSSPHQLWKEKKGLVKRDYNPGMRYGHQLEPVALKLLEKEFLCPFEDQVIFHPKMEWMMASLDAFNEDLKIAAEIKNPNEEDHQLAKEGKIPQKYYGQVQHQLKILIDKYDINELYYFSHRKGDIALIPVQEDQKYIQRLLEKEEEFNEWLEKNIEPPFCSQDYLPWDKEQEKLLKELVALNPKLDALNKRQKEIQEILKKSAQGYNREGYGVRLTRSEVKGAIDYKSIPELKDLDLESHRKASTERWRFTCQL